MPNTYNTNIKQTVTYVDGIAYNPDGTPNADLTDLEVAPVNGLIPVYGLKPDPVIPTDNVKAIPAPKTAQLFTIDIVNKYDWTASKNKQEIASRLFGDKIPFVELTEMRLLGGNMVYSILQAILNIGDITNLYKSAINDNPALEAIGNAIKQAGGDTFVNAAIKGTNAVEGAIGTILDNKFVNSVSTFRDKFISNIPSNLRKNLVDASAIAPYENLYLTELTNVKYRMPYFDNKYMDVRNNFDDSFNGTQKSTGIGAVDNIAGMINSVLDRTLEIASVLEPGVYIERPKFYNFSSVNAPEVNIRFPLLNTLSVESAQRNIQLIHQLTIQNKQYKKSRVLSEQPVIYQVTIPGQVYYPYAYIERMHVGFLGTKRIMKVKIGGNEVEATIPDAYEIDITLRGLNSDSSNFIVAEMGSNKVNITTRKVSQ